MRENHRIGQKRLLLIGFDEIADKVGADVGAVFAIIKIDCFAINLQLRVWEAGIKLGSCTNSTTELLPQAGLIEAKMLRRILIIAQLPFAGNRGRIACLFQLVRKGNLGAVQLTEISEIAFVIEARHYFDTRRRAKRIGEALIKTDTFISEFINVRRAVIFTAVRTMHS